MYKDNNLVKPIDRIIRTMLGGLVLAYAYFIPMHILEFASLHVVTCYIWTTAMLAWDPFYAIVNLIWEKYKARLVDNGRF